MTMAGLTITVAFCTLLCFEVIHGFPISDNTLFVSTSDDAKTYEGAEMACSNNDERLASVRIADIKTKLRSENEGTEFWVAQTDIIKNQCPVVYYLRERLYLKNINCSEKLRYICMPHNPTDFSLMIYIGVGCITLAQILLITVCAVKLSKKKDNATQQIKKTTPKEKPKADKTSKEKSKEDKPAKEKSKKEKTKKPKSERENKKSKKKANKGKDKNETQGIEVDEVKPGIEEGKEGVQKTETCEQKSGVEEDKGETKGTETNEQKSGKEEGETTEKNDEKLVTDLGKELTGGQEQKSEEGGMDVQQASEAKPREVAEVTGDKKEKSELETSEQKLETTVNVSAGKLEKETPLGASASGTATGDGAAKSEFPDPPEFLLSDLTSSFLAGTSIANIVSGTSTDGILSSKTTGDGLTASADVAETTFSTTASTTASDVSTSPPVDVVAVTDVTADTTASAVCASAPVADLSGKIFGLETAGGEMITSGEKKLTEAGFLDDNGATFLPDPPKAEDKVEVIFFEPHDSNGLSGDMTQDEIDV